MKRIITLAVLLTFGVATTHAAEGDRVTSALQASLQKSFAGAKILKWSELGSSNLLFASVLYNNERMNAYFDADGNLIASGRFIKTESLPLIVSKSLNEKYSSASIIDVVEYIEKEGTSYLVTIQDDSKEMVIHAFTDGSSYIFKKSKKNSK
ncbi:MAG TPA: hypothetical protein VLC28_01795 [Flavitalea sp.]|nr:hypothetical protein [Flavitalea sp.]